MSTPRAVRRALAAPAVALRETASNRPLLAVQLAWAGVNLASWTATVALTVAAFELGGAAAVSTAVVVRTLPVVVLGPLVAAWTASWPRARVLRGAAALAAVAAAASAASIGHLVPLALLGLAVTTAAAVFRSAQWAAVPDLADGPRQVASANVLCGGIEAAGVFAGPALAAAVLTLGGTPAAFGLAAACALAGCLALARRETGTSAGTRAAPPAADGADGAAGDGGGAAGSSAARVHRSPVAFLRERFVLLLFVLGLAQTVVGGGLVVLYPGLSDGPLELGDSGVGTLTSAYGLGGVIGTIGLFALAGSRRLGVLTGPALLVWGGPLVALAALTALPLVLLLLAVVGIGNVLFDMAVVTVLQRAAPPALLSQVFAGLGTTAVLGNALGAAVAGPLSALLGPAVAVAALGLPLVVLGAAALPALLRLDRTLAAPTEQVALLRGLPAFALLPTPEVERLALRLRQVTVAAGEEVVRQGDLASTYYLVQSGRLQAEVDGRVVAPMGAGDGFGEIGLLRDMPRTATVRAVTPAALWALDRESFLATMRHGDTRSLLAGTADERLSRAAPRGVPAPPAPPVPESREPLDTPVRGTRGTATSPEAAVRPPGS